MTSALDESTQGLQRETSLSAPGLRDMGTKADVRLMMVAVSLMFTIISLHKQRPGWKRPESQGLQLAGSQGWGEQQRVKRELEIRERVREG